MSEPMHEPGKIELDTVVSWRMIGVGVGLAAGVLFAGVVVALLSGSPPAPA
jgi:hypothetical protein